MTERMTGFLIIAGVVIVYLGVDQIVKGVGEFIEGLSPKKETDKKD